MKLIGYELLKVWNKRTFIFLFIVLLLGNGLFFYKLQKDLNTEQGKHPQDYLAFEDTYKKLAADQGRLQSAELIEELNLYATFSMDVQQMDDPVWIEHVKTTMQDNPEAYERFQQSPYLNNSELIYKELAFATNVFNQYKHFATYKQDMLSMKDKAEQSLAVSIFHDENSFSYRNINKTVEDFESLQGLTLQLGLETGVKAVSDFFATDLCISIMIFLLGIYLFQYEKGMGIIHLLHVTKKGKLDLLIAKIFVLTLLTILFAILFYGSILTIAYSIHGFGDVNRYIQSMPSFKGSVEALTIKQYLTYYLLLKMGVSLLFAMLIAVLFSLFRYIGQVYIVLAGIIGISFLGYTTIHANAHINIVKFINIVAFYDTFGLLTNYRNINLFGHPIRKTTVTFLVGGVSLFSLPLLIIWLGVQNIQIQSRISFMYWWKKVQRFLFRIRLTNSLYQHEWYKSLITGKGVLILLLACFFSYQSIEMDERRFNGDEAAYNRYVTQLEGPLYEGSAFIKSERQRYMNVPNEIVRLQEQLTSNSIDQGDYNIEIRKIEAFLAQEKAFSIVEKQEAYLLRLQQEQKISGHFVNVISTDQLFNRQNVELLNGLLYMTLLLVVLSSLFAMDYRNGMITALRSTRNGKWKLFTTKYIVAYTLGFILLILVDTPMFVNMIRWYPGIDWSAPIQSIQRFEQVDWSVSIAKYITI